MSLQKFENNLFQLEVKTENGEALFNAEKVAKSLGITQIAKSGNEVVRWERVNKYLKLSSPQVGMGDFISEPMVYKLAFKANNALAEKFQDWLATDVLPQIRKHGMYATDELLDNPDLLIEVATKLKEERTKRLIAEQKVAEYEPKITYLDTILASKDTVSTSQIAADYGMSAIQLNKLLHQLGVQRKVSGQWLLYKKHMNCGYTKSHTSEIKQSNGTVKTVMSTKWTQKGRLFMYNLLKDEGYYPSMDLWDNVS
ncbi:DNA-binding protein [Enterococcus faecium]|uniref:phage antirepressor n=1 Tax=Enterococcus faecium TaxID=1352 RepID=UPI000CF3299A|nr:phage antirepressor KilAC domain-containing protein [Enterococcus faecium]PQG45804.1 DNA-binding protein [Enterococcus faecium]